MIEFGVSKYIEIVSKTKWVNTAFNLVYFWPVFVAGRDI